MAKPPKRSEDLTFSGSGGLTRVDTKGRRKEKGGPDLERAKGLLMSASIGGTAGPLEMDGGRGVGLILDVVQELLRGFARGGSAIAAAGIVTPTIPGVDATENMSDEEFYGRFEDLDYRPNPTTGEALPPAVTSPPVVPRSSNFETVHPAIAAQADRWSGGVRVEPAQAQPISGTAPEIITPVSGYPSIGGTVPNVMYTPLPTNPLNVPRGREVFVNVDIVHIEAATLGLRFNVRLRRSRPNRRRKKEVKDRRKLGAGARIALGAMKVFGAATELLDLYEAFAWSCYIMRDGEIVNAAKYMSAQELLHGVVDGTVKVDVPGFFISASAMQVTDTIAGLSGRAVQQGLNDMGWSSPVGFQTMRNMIDRHGDAYRRQTQEADNGIWTAIQSEQPHLGATLNSWDVTREVRVAELFRR